MRGTMLWFNEVKDHGFISTDTGERLYVPGTAFAKRPEGRCAGATVAFDVIEDGEERKADQVSFVEEDAPRRARRRRGAY